MDDTDNNDPDGTTPPEEKKLVLDLDALYPEKVPVQTSLGTLYVGGHAYPPAAVKGAEDEQVGRKVIQHLCNYAQDKADTGALDDGDAAALTDEDISKLGPVISSQQRWPNDESVDTLGSIGKAAKSAVEREHKALQEQMLKMRESLNSGFGFLTKDALRKLQDDMTEMSSLRRLAASAGADSMFAKGIQDIILKRPDDGVLGAIKRFESPLDESLRKMPEAFPPASVEPRINLPLRIPRPEESPLGQAALQNAENSRQSVELMRELTQRMALVQETLVVKVLPQWFAQVERAQEKAKSDSAEAVRNTKNAVASLRWAKWAILASIVATGLATCWQVYVAQEIDRGTTKQLETTEAVLREQLAAQRQALEQQRSEARQLRELLQEAQQRQQPRAPAAKGAR
jgi:hypothetical protein